MKTRQIQESKIKIELARKRLKNNPNDSRSLYILGFHELCIGGDPKQYWEKAAVLGHAGAIYELARRYCFEDPDKALSYIAPALETDPKFDVRDFDTQFYSQEEYRKILRQMKQTLETMSHMKKFAPRPFT